MMKVDIGYLEKLYGKIVIKFLRGGFGWFFIIDMERGGRVLNGV